jgi:hypothetical protein
MTDPIDESPDNVEAVLPLDLTTELPRTCRETDFELSDAFREAVGQWCKRCGPVLHTDLGAYLDRHWDDIAKAVNAAIDWYSDVPQRHSDDCAVSECYHCQNLDVAGVWIGHVEALQRIRDVR